MNILILAGSYYSAHRCAEQRELVTGTWSYLYSINQLRGYYNMTVYLGPGWKMLDNADDIMTEITIRGGNIINACSYN